jgi:hypothetical protein
MGLGKVMAGGLTGLLMTIMAWMACDVLITPGESDILDLMAVMIPMALGFGTVMYVIVSAFKTQD